MKNENNADQPSEPTQHDAAACSGAQPSTDDQQHARGGDNRDPDPTTASRLYPIDYTKNQGKIFAVMKSRSRWLLWKAIQKSEASGKISKIPYYADGSARRGQLDTQEDISRLVTYDKAAAALQNGGYSGLGFALGLDEGWYWQGVDFDNVNAHPHLREIMEQAPGYVEVSPSENGYHAIGVGRPFSTLGSNGSGIEAYCGGRFFTVTEKTLFDTSFSNGSACLAEYVERMLAPIHRAKPASGNRIDGSANPGMYIDPKTVTELRSALNSIPADGYKTWIDMGLALAELGDTGRELWMTWSATSEKFNSMEASQKWRTLKPSNIGYQTVFYTAQEHGWVNPKSKEAQIALQPKSPNVGALPPLSQRTPVDIMKRVYPPPFQLDDAPPVLARFASALSQASGFDHSAFLVAGVTAAGAMIHDACKLQVRPSWEISARQWSVLIGFSASGKSPTIRYATETIKKMHHEEFARWKVEKREWEKAKKEERDAEPPPRPARYTGDTTVAALSDTLRHNPQGVLMLTEELSTLLGTMDSGNTGDAAANRGAWLKLRDGGPEQIDRIVRGSFTVDNWGASVLAACTPGGLAKQMKDVPEDGLIQRFTPCLMQKADFDAPSRNLDPTDALQEWDSVLRRIDGQATRQSGCGCICFTTEAQTLFNKAEKEVKELSEAAEGICSAYSSHLGKHPGMLAEVCLIFHFLSGSEHTTKPCIEPETVATAIKYMQRVARHAYYLYTTVLSAAPPYDLAIKLARSIAAKDDDKPMNRDWMIQHCTAFRKADDRIRREAVEMLIDTNWLEPDESRGKYMTWPRRYEVNEQVFKLYSEEGEEWRKRRELVKKLIAED